MRTIGMCQPYNLSLKKLKLGVEWTTACITVRDSTDIPARLRQGLRLVHPHSSVPVTSEASCLVGSCS
jgi:hypothetical protein